MTEPTAPRPLKRAIPPDLQRQVEDIQTKKTRIAGPPGDLNEEEKRWLIVGICLHSIISPLLRKYADPIVSKLFNSLVSSDSINTQRYNRYLKKYPATNRYFLNYESINNNRIVPKTKMYNKWVNDYQRYDFKVTNHVDLSKLFLQPSMAHYSRIDESCDSSALLGLVINISTFPPVLQAVATKVRSDIRNRWAHCDFTEWTSSTYTDSFDLMGQLVKNLCLSNKEENRILGDLNTWGTNGQNFMSGSTLGLELVEKIRQQLTEADNQFIREHTELKDLENGLLGRIRNLENLAMKHELKLKCVEEEMKKIEDHIPKNIRAQHGQEIREWEQNQISFVETRATRHILEFLRLNNCIVVTGSSGCGKSSNIHYAALKLRDKFGYEIIPVLTGPADIISYYNENKRQVFVVDDICGKETINTQTLQVWSDFAEKMEKKFKMAEKEVVKTKDDIVSKVSSPKLLISCRLHIYKESQFQRVSLLTENECNLLSTELCLLQEERMLMMRKYLPDDTIGKLNEKQFIENVDFFPLVCKMAKSKKPEDVQKPFEAPLNSIKLNIQNIINANKDQFCALALCIIFDDGFNTEWLKLTAAPDEKKYKIREIVDEFDIKLDKQLHRDSLKSGFSTLDETFLKLKGTEYRIIHDKIYKLAAVICGQKLTECFIKYAPSVFIRDRFIFKSLADVHKNDDIIVLCRTQEEDYFKRLLCDLKHDNITSTFNNNQLIYQSFMNKLIGFFRISDDAKSVLKNLDTQKCIIEKNLPFSFKTTPLIESASRGYFDIVQFMICDIKCNVKNTDSRHRSPLHKASQGGHSDVVKLLLENKADISQRDVWGESPLHLACEGGYKETVELLLQYNADVSQCDKDKQSPLHKSCKGGHTDIVKLLLEKNADIFQCDIWEKSPLYEACEGGYTDTVDCLLQYNADVFRCNTYHKCPLHVTCEKGHVNILNLLMQNDSRISQCSQPPLHFACKGGHIDIVKILLQHNADVLQCDRYGYSPLCVSCENGHIEIVKLLLQNNADVTVYEDDDCSSLYVSCERGYTEIVKLLLQNNADASTWGIWEAPPLCIACFNGETEIVELLLQYNADVSQCNYNGDSPLYMAVHYIDIMKLLLENKADPSACNNHGDSPLFVACEQDSIDIVKLLLQYNADVSRCNNDGESPLYMACKNKSIEIVKLLLQFSADLSRCINIKKSPLNVACKKDSIEIVKLLLENNADASQFTNDGKSPLFVACKYNCIDIVKLLLQYSVDVNRCTIDGESPLYMACKNKSIEIVKLLLQFSADLSRCINTKKSPLNVACKKDSIEIVKLLLENNADASQFTYDRVSPMIVACQHTNIDIVKLLLQYNADVSHCNNKGESPLYIACKWGSTDLVKLLLENNADISQCEKKNGLSPLHVACDIDSSDLFQLLYKDSPIEIVRILLAWNADAGMCNKKGQTPLDIARESQCKEIVHLLEKNLQL